MFSVKKAVILAAGRGTRFLPYTKAMPKEMIAVVDRPAIDIIIDEVADSGIEDILIIISPDKEAMVRHFSVDDRLESFLTLRDKQSELDIVKRISSRAKISFEYQNEANGSGEAVMLAKEFAQGEAVAVLNGDDAMYCSDCPPVTKQLMDCYARHGKSVLGVQKVSREVIGKYASCDIIDTVGKDHLIRGVIEKPKSDAQITSLLAPLGRYIISPDFFQYIVRTPVAANGELQFTDSLNLEAGERGIIAYEFEGKRYDLGDKLGYMKASVEYCLRDKELGARFARYLEDIDLSEYVKE